MRNYANDYDEIVGAVQIAISAIVPSARVACLDEDRDEGSLDDSYLCVRIFNVPESYMLEVEDRAYDIVEGLRRRAGSPSVSFLLYTSEETAKLYPKYGLWESGEVIIGRLIRKGSWYPLPEREIILQTELGLNVEGGLVACYPSWSYVSMSERFISSVEPAATVDEEIAKAA